MVSDENPFESPKSDIFSPSSSEELSRAEQIRRDYLNHEASVRSIGVLYWLAAGLLSFSFVIMLAVKSNDGAIILLMISFVFIAALVIVGYGLRKLARWVRIPVGIMSGLGILAGFRAFAFDKPIVAIVGIGINIYVLYLLWSEKGKYVCSEEYREIIAQTPHIKYKTSIIVKILAGLLLFIILLSMVSFVFMRH